MTVVARPEYFVLSPAFSSRYFFHSPDRLILSQSKVKKGSRQFYPHQNFYMRKGHSKSQILSTGPSSLDVLSLPYTMHMVIGKVR